MEKIPINIIKNTLKCDSLDNILCRCEIEINKVGYHTENYNPQKIAPAITIDYQLIYVCDGTIKILLNNKEYICKSNDVILIPPFCCRMINGLSESDSHYIFIHFNFNTQYMNRVLERLIFGNNSPYKITNVDQHIAMRFWDISQREKISKIALYTFIKTELIQIIIELFTMNNKTIPDNLSSANQAFIMKATEFIDSNLSKNITSKMIADYLNVSESYLYKIFTNSIRLSPNKYIQLTKAQTAALLIKTTDFSLCEISDILGFNAYNYFSKFFKKWYKVSPKDYKKI